MCSICLCVVAYFPQLRTLAKGPIWHAMAQLICQATTTSRGCRLSVSLMNKTRGSTGRWQCSYPHNLNHTRTFPHTSTTAPVCRPTVGETLGPRGCSAPQVERIPTCCQCQLTLGKTIPLTGLVPLVCVLLDGVVDTQWAPGFLIQTFFCLPHPLQTPMFGSMGVAG
jgi:hypothetical protein